MNDSDMCRCDHRRDVHGIFDGGRHGCRWCGCRDFLPAPNPECEACRYIGHMCSWCRHGRLEVGDDRPAPRPWVLEIQGREYVRLFDYQALEEQLVELEEDRRNRGPWDAVVSAALAWWATRGCETPGESDAVADAEDRLTTACLEFCGAQSRAALAPTGSGTATAGVVRDANGVIPADVVGTLRDIAPASRHEGMWRDVLASHEALRRERDDAQRERDARGAILNDLQAAAGSGSWYGVRDVLRGMVQPVPPGPPDPPRPPGVAHEVA